MSEFETVAALRDEWERQRNNYNAMSASGDFVERVLAEAERLQGEEAEATKWARIAEQQRMDAETQIAALREALKDGQTAVISLAQPENSPRKPWLGDMARAFLERAVRVLAETAAVPEEGQ